MEDLLEEIEAALGANLYMVAIFIAVTIPDICSALESEDGEGNSSRYKDWFNRYMGAKYNAKNGLVKLSAEDFWCFRCALLHQGKTQHAKLSYSRIAFLPIGTGINFNNCQLGNLYITDPVAFCCDIIAACRKWLSDVNANTNFIKNESELIKKRDLAPLVLPAIKLGSRIGIA